MGKKVGIIHAKLRVQQCRELALMTVGNSLFLA